MKAGPFSPATSAALPPSDDLASVYLMAALRQVCPTTSISSWPRGVWQDAARIAVEMALAEDTAHSPTWTPCRCGPGADLGIGPGSTGHETRSRRGKKFSGATSAADKAANTAALLAALTSKGTVTP